MKYNEFRCDFRTATHWIPEEDSVNGCHATLTTGKPYSLFISEWDGECCINEDDGSESPTFIYHKGYFVNLPQK